jgi:hypothetical protein
MDSYLPHECLPIAVMEPLSMYLDLRAHGKGWPLITMLERRVEIWDLWAQQDVCMNGLLILSLFVQRVLEPKRRTPTGSQGNSTEVVQSHPLVAIRR